MAPTWDIDPNEDPYHGDGPAPSDRYKFNAPPDLNTSEIGKTLLPKLQDLGPTRMAGQQTRPVPLEHVLTFDEGLNAVKDIVDDIAPNHHTTWANIAKSLNEAVSTLSHARDSNLDKITGETANAMFQKIKDALPYLTSLAQAAARMDPLVDSFSRDLKETRDWFRNMESERQTNIDKVKKVLDATTSSGSESPLDRDRNLTMLAISQVNEQYNSEAKNTIQSFYNPPISYISHNHPDMSATPPQVGSPGPSGAGPRLSPGGSGTPGGAGGLGGLGTPSATKGWAGQDTPPQQTMPQSAAADAAKGAGDAAKGLTDAASDAGQQAQSALGQAGDAAKQALDQALQAAQQDGAGSLPEGVLGLGPTSGGLGASGAGSARGGGGVGGVGSLGAREASLPKLGTQQASTVAPTSATQAARAGVSSASGGTGAGAPAAGHRGGEGGDKIHKVSKALRTNKNGEEVVDEPTAVVPVVGEQPEPATSNQS